MSPDVAASITEYASRQFLLTIPSSPFLFSALSTSALFCAARYILPCPAHPRFFGQSCPKHKLTKQCFASHTRVCSTHPQVFRHESEYYVPAHERGTVPMDTRPTHTIGSALPPADLKEIFHAQTAMQYAWHNYVLLLAVFSCRSYQIDVLPFLLEMVSASRDSPPLSC